MEDYRNMLRQVLLGRSSCNQIAAQRSMSHHTVRRALRLAREAELTVERLDELGDAEIRKLFYPHTRTADFIEPDWEEERVYLRPGRNRLEGYARYRDRVGEGRAMAYRTYCVRLKAYLDTLDITMRLEHLPGQDMQTDFAGYKPLAYDHDGTLREWKLFVACLPFSNLVHASITSSEKIVEHIAANVAALEYIGGATVSIVPDNLKAAILSRQGGVVKVQVVYQSFADHYCLAVRPARPKRPQDKSGVENAVKLIQRSLRVRGLDRPIPRIAELKERLAGVVDDWNAKVMRRAGGHSRRSLYEAEERQHMQPLPRYPFECFEAIRKVRVGRDYHVEHAGSFYSVPYRFVSKSATVKVKAASIQVFIDGLLVASHPRHLRPGATVTNPAHRPASHAAYASTDLTEWAQRYPEAVCELAAVEMAREVTPQMRSRRSAWVKSLPRIHSRQRFVLACERAVALNDKRFEHVANVLERGIEGAPPPDAVGQGVLRPGLNVRGSGDFGLEGERA